jgi:hypothetical protein
MKKYFVDPNASNAFTSETVHKVVLNNIDFELSDDVWDVIDDAFGHYWNVEVGYGAYPDLNSAVSSISAWLKKENVIFPIEKIVDIVNVIFDWVEQVPGAILDENEVVIPHSFADHEKERQKFKRLERERSNESAPNFNDSMTNFVYISDKLKEFFPRTYRRLIKLFDEMEIEWDEIQGTKDIWIRDGLYALISDVLFVRDHRNPNLFHPRISVQFDFIYESLTDSDKFLFNNLYNDYFYRRNNQYWYTEAMKKLPRLVEATRMLVCAEDLGMVPDCVAWVMNQLRILSLEIQSMPKDPTTRFGKLKHNPYRSVCTISSHDMPTLRQWWDEDEQRTQEYYSCMLHRGGAAPHPLPGWLARDIVSRQLTSPSMLCILSIQDWMAIDEQLRLKDPNAERINIPANPKHYWRYRMHVSIEELMSNRSFTENVKELVLQSGRK